MKNKEEFKYIVRDLLKEIYNAIDDDVEAAKLNFRDYCDEGGLLLLISLQALKLKEQKEA